MQWSDSSIDFNIRMRVVERVVNGRGRVFSGIDALDAHDRIQALYDIDRHILSRIRGLTTFAPGLRGPVDDALKAEGFEVPQ